MECVILHKDTPKIYHICMRTQTPVDTFRYSLALLLICTRSFLQPRVSSSTERFLLNCHKSHIYLLLRRY